jgi:hypothetical protein
VIRKSRKRKSRQQSKRQATRRSFTHDESDKENATNNQSQLLDDEQSAIHQLYNSIQKPADPTALTQPTEFVLS